MGNHYNQKDIRYTLLMLQSIAQILRISNEDGGQKILGISKTAEIEARENKEQSEIRTVNPETETQPSD